MTARRDNSVPEVPVTPEFWISPGKTAAELRRRYGDLFRLNTRDGRSWICGVGIDAVKAFLLENISKLSNFQGWMRLSPAAGAIGRGIVFMDGDDHRWFREVLAPAFTPAEVARHAPLIHEIAKRRIAEWPTDGVIGLYEDVNRITFAVASAVMLGLRDPANVDELHRVFKQVTVWGSTPPSAAVMRSWMAEALGPTIRERMEKPGDDMLSRIVIAGGPGGSALAESDLLTHANMMLIAGYFTSSALCSYLLLKLTEHPDFTQRLFEEQIAIGSEEELALAQTPLLDRALSEAERWVTSLPHLPRQVEEDIAFQGHRVRKGEFVLCSIAGMHRDPNLYSDPDRFDPDRFGPGGDRLRDPLAFSAFGAGPRRCLGTVLARTMIKIIVHHVVRGFELTAEPTAFDPPLYLPICRPMNPMPMRVKARGTARAPRPERS